MLAQSADAIPPLFEWWRSIGKWFRFGKPDSTAGQEVQATIAPTLDFPVTDGQNLAWCGTLQLAWNEARNCFGGGPIQLDPPSPLADALNHQPFNRDCIDPASIFTAVGAIDAGIIERIREHLRKMGAPESRVLGADGLGRGVDEFICYARLDKNLQFPKPFGRLGYRPLAGRKVPCFGYLKDTRNADDSRQQTLIHHYETPQDFVVELKTQDNEDTLVLAKTAPAPTLREIVSAVTAQIQTAPIVAWRNDVLIVPCINLSCLEKFTELQGRRIFGSLGWLVKSAMQSIDFQMDEKGVLLRSEAQISFSRSLAAVAQHVMILEPPFLLLMKRKNSNVPYFATWIANADLLRRSG